MTKVRKRGINLVSVIVFVVLAFWLANDLGSNKSMVGARPVSLVDVTYDACFSPNGDGSKDQMNLDARFSGTSGRRVSAVLFIKHEGAFIRFLSESALFSSAGEATVSLQWDGKDWLRRDVTDNTYELNLYYLNFSFFARSGQTQPDMVFNQFEAHMARPGPGRIVNKWQGEVKVDRVAPVLDIAAPEDYLQTSENTVLTSGTVSGGKNLTINGQDVALDNGVFEQSLPLAAGENEFQYILEDCAGNRDEQIRRVVRVSDTSPPAIFINEPFGGGEYSSLPIPVAVSYTDGGSGIDTATVTVVLNGADITSGLTVADNGIMGSIASETHLNQGANSLNVEVSDNAGNPGSASVEFNYEMIQEEDRTIIYGRVLDSLSGDAISGAVIASSGVQVQSDGEGNWSLTFGSGGTYKIKINKTGYTSVYRRIYLDTGKEGVVEDAYLTAQDTQTTPIGPDGGTHTNTGATVEVVIPQGALSEVKDIQVTRLPSSKALPGDLNETDNLKYPISFLFCGDFGPDEITFATSVTIRVKNTWGFDPGFEIPYAHWDKDNLKWIPIAGMAKVDAAGEWIEASVSHFSTIDINIPSGTELGGGPSASPSYPDCPVCEVGSTVWVHSGTLMNNFSIPGVKVRGGDTGVSFVYNSATASPFRFVRINYYHDDDILIVPDTIGMSSDSPLIANTGSGGSGSGGRAWTGHFLPHMGGGAAFNGIFSLFVNGQYPSGRYVKSGYQEISFKATNYYPGVYAFTPFWGDVPTYLTGIPSPERSYYDKQFSERVFIHSRRESAAGSGWGVVGVKRLQIDGNRVVVTNGDGTFREYEQGVNYARSSHGASLLESSAEIIHPENMLRHDSLRLAAGGLLSQFRYGLNIRPPSGTNQTMVIDLGQERTLYTIGVDFREFWRKRNVWDFIRISTSTDNLSYSEWHTQGEPTLEHPDDQRDMDDFLIQAPLKVSRADRSVRYIKYELGYPAINVDDPGATILGLYAIGGPEEYRDVEDRKWPKLTYDAVNQEFLLTEFDGSQTVFTQSGLMIKKKDRQGRTISFQYNGEDISRIYYPEGVYMDFEYSGDRISKVRDSSGRETIINTDSEGRITEVVYPDASKREFAYDDRGLMILDKKGESSKKYIWDAAYPVLKQVLLPNGGSRTLDPWYLKYAANGIASSETSPVAFPYVADNREMVSTVTFEDGREKTYVMRNETTETHHNGELKEKVFYGRPHTTELPYRIEKGEDAYETTTIAYTDEMQVQKIESKVTDNQWTSSGTNHPYSDSGIPITVTPRKLVISYNDSHWVSQITGWDTDKLFTYDSGGNLTTVLDQKLSRTMSYTYDTNNNLTRVDYPDGKKNEFVYDSKGLILEVINNDDSKTTVTRNTRGEIATITDEENRTVEIERDNMGRVVKETSPGGRTVFYTWGGTGCPSCGGDVKLTKIVDSGNKEWGFEYDLMGNPTAMIYPDGTRIEQTYDIASRLETFTNKRGQEIIYDYDGDGRLIKKTTPEGEVDFSYDDRDRLDAIQGTDFHYVYTYGVAGVSAHSSAVSVVQENNQLSAQWTQYLANHHGLPLMVFDSYDWKKLYTYNFSTTPIAPMPISIHHYKKDYGVNSYSAVYNYWANNQVRTATNNFFSRDQKFEYDANNILSRTFYRQKPGVSGNYPYVDYHFNRDASGLITSITGDKELSANYNPDLEIESVNHTIPQTFDESYTYDPRGNRLTSLTDSYEYNDLNQLRTASTLTSTLTFSYDEDGNMTEEKNTATTETKKFFFNSENRMIRYEHYPTDIEPADVVSEYKYDIYGCRIQKSVNGSVTNFLWEGDNLAYELDLNYQPIRRYVYGIGKDDLKGHVEYAEASSDVFNPAMSGWYSYVKDQVGTINQVYSHQSQAVVDNRTYDVFGKLVSQSGSSAGNMGFQSKYFDVESGLNYYYHRYYYPQVGRFINEDPIGFEGGYNFYNFANNDLINFRELWGLSGTSQDEDNVIDDWAEEAGRAAQLAREALEELRRLKEKWKRHDEQEAMRYCPTYPECVWNCIKEAFGWPDLVITGLSEGGKLVGKIKAIKILESAGSAASRTSMATSGVLVLYCEIHCGINVKAY